jgi:hypothetical protein
VPCSLASPAYYYVLLELLYVLRAFLKHGNEIFSIFKVVSRIRTDTQPLSRRYHALPGRYLMLYLYLLHLLSLLSLHRETCQLIGLGMVCLIILWGVILAGIILESMF